MKKILIIIVSIVIVFSIIFTGCSTATSGNKIQSLQTVIRKAEPL